ncbi:MAG: NAD+ synthase [Bdellovibrionia bacterium]
MRIAIAQLNLGVGAFVSNLKKIEQAYERACEDHARLLVTSELAVSGYPLLDLLDRPELLEQTQQALERLRALTEGKSCALVVGHLQKNPQPEGPAAQNAVTVFERGHAVFHQAKTLLPNYDVFDESRVFEPAREIRLWNCEGTSIGLAICEDLWASERVLGRKRHRKNPLQEYQKQGVGLLISLSASPYELGKTKVREALHSRIARELGVPLVYVNQVGGVDEVLFDGGSFVVDAEGKNFRRLPLFDESYGVIEVAQTGRVKALTSESSPISWFQEELPEEIESLTRALVMGIQDYVRKTGFKSVVLGLSGGIDSAVVAALAVRALGPKSVLGVAMPSPFSSSHSLEDAEVLARQLGCRFEVSPIKFIYQAWSRELGATRGGLAPVASENLQARLRGVILMTLANHENALVLTTGNKSELAMGYCTLYGDMAGALAPLGDVLKTRVYEVARYINQNWGNWIPERSLTKPPSAELRPDQKDQDTLPPYEVLDGILEGYLEKAVGVDELRQQFDSRCPEHTGGVVGILRKLHANEYKRKQAAPVLKVSSKAFGLGRRVPLVQNWESF